MTNLVAVIIELCSVSPNLLSKAFVKPSIIVFLLATFGMLPLKLTSWYEPLSSTLDTSSVELKLFYVLQNGMKGFDI